MVRLVGWCCWEWWEGCFLCRVVAPGCRRARFLPAAVVVVVVVEVVGTEAVLESEVAEIADESFFLRARNLRSRESEEPRI